MSIPAHQATEMAAADTTAMVMAIRTEDMVVMAAMAVTAAATHAVAIRAAAMAAATAGHIDGGAGRRPKL